MNEPERTTVPNAAARRAAASFHSVHGRRPDSVWSAPGRVNLIGEHTDYNGGFVLPFALPHRTAAAVAARNDAVLTVATLGSDGRLQHAQPLRLSRLRPGRPSGWAAYIAGVAWVLRDHGLDRGADIVVATDVPSGAGLSSSAALECAVVLALLAVMGRPEPGMADRVRLAHWAHRAENEFVGVPTGVLDQIASLCCTAGHVLFLDVATGLQEHVPFDVDSSDLVVLVIDTRVRHRHSDSGYAERRRAATEAARHLGVTALGELSCADLGEAMSVLPAPLRPVARHVVTENARVLDVVRSLRSGRTTDIGPTLDASHESLRTDYRVSTPELDLAVDLARSAGALGARMTGGGFGGAAIALVPCDAVSEVESAVRAGFRRAALRTPRSFTAVPSEGADRD